MISHYQPLPAMTSRCQADARILRIMRTLNVAAICEARRIPLTIQAAANACRKVFSQGNKGTGEIKQTFIMAFHEPVSVTGTVLLFLGCFPSISRETVDRLKSRQQNGA
jgi:hypothetical protein